MQQQIKNWLKSLFPNQIKQVQYWRMYAHATRKLGNKVDERESLFDALVQRSAGKDCLQIGVRGNKYAPHWLSVDLYDQSPLIDFNYDVQDMPFEDGSFDMIVCKAVLEHVPYPQKAIAEFYRLLRPGGEVWIEIPFNQPYHAHPNDYWRVTPWGMRVWMEQFEEQAVGLFSPHYSNIYNGIFYHGIKAE